ncbi:FCD domain-containing protein [Microbispora triticiradicis]|uniref:FCD domain-containing protein n=1 Tax=Microbispora triticiradicis TaxID=2200763 RepID=UPI001AD6F509|nr:FCD domain-containing protein [Microbispora triticiradicis]
MPTIAQVIREALAHLHTHVHLFRLLHDTQVTHLAMAEHEEVPAAIAARDPDAAAYAMRRHILLSGERFRRLFRRSHGFGRNGGKGLTGGPGRGMLTQPDRIGLDPPHPPPMRGEAGAQSAAPYRRRRRGARHHVSLLSRAGGRLGRRRLVTDTA